MHCNGFSTLFFLNMGLLKAYIYEIGWEMFIYFPRKGFPFICDLHNKIHLWLTLCGLLHFGREFSPLSENPAMIDDIKISLYDGWEKSSKLL